MPELPQPTKFSAAYIHSAINEMMQNDVSLPANKRVGFFSVMDSTEARAVTAVKINDSWHVQAEVSHPWSGGTTFGIELKGLI